MARTKCGTLFVAALIFATLPTAEPPVAVASERDELALFENDVRPLLTTRCIKCHGAAKQESGLRLDSKRLATKGGDRGPAIVPGDPERSLLVQAARRTGELKMPPDDSLKPEEVAGLVEWIRQGALWPAESVRSSTRGGSITAQERQFWSFQPLGPGAPPEVHDVSWLRTPIDRFILARLEAARLKPVGPADKRTLIRRATFDLTGLPPTPDDVEAFVADGSPDAFAKVVDRLLTSPAYGERWGRHWLDVVRYADTAGETADFPVREAYRYRNYVLASFKSDKPFDRFVREQIAGDLYANEGPPEQYEDLVAATGFIAVSRRFGFDSENYQYLTIQDTIDTLGQAVLGLSLGCAMPRSQIRPGQCGRLLRALWHLREHAVRLSGFGTVETSPRFRSGSPALGCSATQTIPRHLRGSRGRVEKRPNPTPRRSHATRSGSPPTVPRNFRRRPAACRR